MSDEMAEGGWMERGLEPATPEANYLSARRPRISGTALVGGLHLATGNYGTAPWWRLLVSGGMIVLLLSIALAMSFIELWALDQLQNTNFAVSLLGLAVPSETAWGPYAAIGLQLLPMINFLIVLRLSPLSGYHAAEHKVVAAIEAYGAINHDQVVEMPRAHPRCGTVLLFGVLPALLVAWPLFQVEPLAAAAVAIVGWSLRYHVGYFIQQYFTTKPPTPAQLRAGMEAGRKLMALWQREPDRQVSVAQAIWTRGMPQMIVGVLAAQWLLGRLYDHLHLWLDF